MGSELSNWSVVIDATLLNYLLLLEWGKGYLLFGAAVIKLLQSVLEGGGDSIVYALLSLRQCILHLSRCQRRATN